MTFRGAPALPDWLERNLPFRRRIHIGQPHDVHFVDHGEGRPVLMIHGNPMWCYLYRKIIPQVVQAGFRAVAPDLVGFGLSSKPRRVRDHSLRMHVDRICEVVEALDLREVTLVGQDWGGPVAAGVGARLPDRVRAAVFGNTSVLRPARPFRPKAFHRFAQTPVVSDLAFRGLMFPIPVLRQAQGDPGSIGWQETLAYSYPFQNPLDRAGPLALARMVPNAELHPTTAEMDRIGAWTEAFRGPTALVWGTKDPILGRALRRHREALPHAEVTETEAGHFIQEEIPDLIAKAILQVSR